MREGRRRRRPSILAALPPSRPYLLAELLIIRRLDTRTPVSRCSGNANPHSLLYAVLHFLLNNWFIIFILDS